MNNLSRRGGEAFGSVHNFNVQQSTPPSNLTPVSVNPSARPTLVGKVKPNHDWYFLAFLVVAAIVLEGRKV